MKADVYGITPEIEAKMRAETRDTCFVCRMPETINHYGKTKSLSIDHDHVSGRVRGLLCFGCNALMTRIDMNPAQVEALAARLIDYARSSRDWRNA